MQNNRFTCSIHKVVFSFLLLTLFLSLFTSCKSKSEAENDSGKESLPEEKNQVEVMVLQQQDFTREIISNGKLAAIQKAELYFENPGIIEAIHFGNGAVVNKGTEIARLENQDYLFNLQKAETAMEQAEIDKLDALISMGYKTENAAIPPEHLKIANIRSGYNRAKIQLEEARHQLASATLKAPFTGKVEGIKQKPYEKADLSKPFCTLINDHRFTIEFPLLETEIGEVKQRQAVSVIPVSGAAKTTGVVTEINPRIDENGLAWLKAEVTNPGGYMEGMNVKVSIQKAIPGQLVVPRQAVVLRQNQEVLFRYTNGTAYWTYVKVLDENENHYSVTAAEGATLEAGDTVIISNNLNLAHESEVEIE